jgi:hypothetical protein
LEVRGVDKKNNIQAGSLIIARAPIPAKNKKNKKKTAHTWYLAKVLGVFGRSGTKFGGTWREQFASTGELSPVFMPVDVSGSFIDKGEA